MKKKRGRLTKALLVTAREMLDGGLLGEKKYKKITLRHLVKERLPKIEPMTSEEIRSLRAKAHLSQAAFAMCLNLTVGYISQLERGLKKPKGAVLALLNVVRHNGIDVVWGKRSKI